ncbi:MAG TPA: hypothetical protein PL105_26970, partial [Caldilineaceae bacterium]|nr:hypothetical protein [Caldilineaceae bacterium]
GQLEGLAETVDEVIHHLRCGTDGEAFARLPDTLDGLQSLAPLLDLLGSRQLLPAPEVEHHIAELGRILTEVMNSWQNENLVEMADLLKFSLRSLLIQTHDTFSDLAVELTIARLSSQA